MAWLHFYLLVRVWVEVKALFLDMMPRQTNFVYKKVELGGLINKTQ